MGFEAHEAARRLGVLDEFLDATDVPDAARAAARLGKPEEFLLVRDGRAQHAGNIVVWLARSVSDEEYRYQIIGRAAVLPRKGSWNVRPGIYTQADKLGIPCEALTRPGYDSYSGKSARVHVVGRGQPDLTGALVEIVEDDVD